MDKLTIYKARAYDLMIELEHMKKLIALESVIEQSKMGKGNTPCDQNTQSEQQ